MLENYRKEPGRSWSRYFRYWGWLHFSFSFFLFGFSLILLLIFVFAFLIHTVKRQRYSESKKTQCNSWSQPKKLEYKQNAIGVKCGNRARKSRLIVSYWSKKSREFATNQQERTRYTLHKIAFSWWGRKKVYPKYSPKPPMSKQLPLPCN